MKNTIFFVMLMSLLPFAANATDLAVSPDRDFYIGVGHGLASVEGPRTRGTFRLESNNILTIGTYEPDQQLKGSVGVSEIHVGYNVNPFLSFELGYADYDKERVTYPHQEVITVCITSPCNSLTPSPDSVEIDTSVVSLGALLKYPVHTNFSIYGLLSYDRVKNSYRRRGNKDSEVSRQVGYGAGIRWAFSEDFAAKLQWKKTQTIHTDFAYNERLNLSDTRLILEMSL